MMRRYSHPTGFTLIELLLVILLLSSLAFTATAFVDNAGQQMGFDQTKSRLEQIRRAIIGDTSRSINGQPELSGFVVDMGRLPKNLSELIEPPETEPPETSQLWNAEPIPGGELYGGWRGPYLDAMPESSGTRAFRDGWGNQGQTTDVNAADYDGNNYGWIFKKEDDPATTDIDESTRIFLQSLGADFAAGQADTDNPYQKDYPASGNLVSENDWRVDVSNQEFKVQINGPATTTDDLQLKIYWLKNRALQTITSDAAKASTGGLLTVKFTPDPDNPPLPILPIGSYAAVVVCTVDNVPFSGDCANHISPTPKPQYFKIIPRSYQPPLEITWNTQ